MFRSDRFTYKYESRNILGFNVSPWHFADHSPRSASMIQWYFYTLRLISYNIILYNMQNGLSVFRNVCVSRLIFFLHSLNLHLINMWLLDSYNFCFSDSYFNIWSMQHTKIDNRPSAHTHTRQCSSRRIDYNYQSLLCAH